MTTRNGDCGATILAAGRMMLIHNELVYREAKVADIPGMAEVRAGDWGSEPYWRGRIREYLAGELTPREGAPTRIAFICADGDRIAGLIAGHLTRRHGCSGELQWLSVRPEYRGRGIASELLRRLAKWFAAHDAHRVCVDVEPSNGTARRFYARHGAHDLKPHWMAWEDIGRVCEEDEDAARPTTDN